MDLLGIPEKLADISPQALCIELNHLSELIEIEVTLNYNSYPYQYKQALDKMGLFWEKINLKQWCSCWKR